MTTITIFDLDFALSQLSNNESLLIKLLDKFSSDYANVASELELHVAKQEFKIAKDKAHMLKGVAGNLGMKGLQLACRELEQPLLNHTVDANQLTQFTHVFHETLQATANAVEQLQSQHKKLAESELSSEQQLIEKLKKYEFIPSEELDQLLTHLSIASPQLGTLKQSIIDLEYDTALTILNQD